MKKCLKLRKHTFKNIHTFFESVTDKPVFNEGLVFSDKLFHVNSKTRVSNARGSPQGRLMPSPRAATKLRMPHPRDWHLEQMPRGCPGGGGGGWAPLELIDAIQTHQVCGPLAIHFPRHVCVIFSLLRCRGLSFSNSWTESNCNNRRAARCVHLNNSPSI